MSAGSAQDEVFIVMRALEASARSLSWTFSLSWRSLGFLGGSLVANVWRRICGDAK